MNNWSLSTYYQPMWILVGVGID
uniref:Uncharacterized protein n=1 Tax=Tetranychus urticae TaxID=32264 RepID=T1KKH8_TETUR